MASNTKKPAWGFKALGLSEEGLYDIRDLHVSMTGELTRNEEEDASCKCLVKPIEGGVVDEGHDADDDANETSQQGKNHEGPSGIPVCCGDEGDEVLRTTYMLSITIIRIQFFCQLMELI